MSPAFFGATASACSILSAFSGVASHGSHFVQSHVAGVGTGSLATGSGSGGADTVAARLMILANGFQFTRFGGAVAGGTGEAGMAVIAGRRVSGLAMLVGAATSLLGLVGGATT